MLFQGTEAVEKACLCEGKVANFFKEQKSVGSKHLDPLFSHHLFLLQQEKKNQLIFQPKKSFQTSKILGSFSSSDISVLFYDEMGKRWDW